MNLLQNDSGKKEQAMSNQACEFESLIEQIRLAFYNLPSPESEVLKWTHIGSADYVNNELSDILQFLTK